MFQVEKMFTFTIFLKNLKWVNWPEYRTRVKCFYVESTKSSYIFQIFSRQTNQNNLYDAENHSIKDWGFRTKVKLDFKADVIPIFESKKKVW